MSETADRPPLRLLTFPAGPRRRGHSDPQIGPSFHEALLTGGPLLQIYRITQLLRQRSPALADAVTVALNRVLLTIVHRFIDRIHARTARAMDLTDTWIE